MGDIPLIADEWRDGLAQAETRAFSWRADARLIELGVACAPLEPAFRWRGTFYSNSAQSFFLTDTGQSRPAEVDPASVVTLPREQVTFAELHRALARAGYADDSMLGATSGITVRLNVTSDRFGPPETPDGVVFHVVADDGRGANDLFVSATDWLVRTYSGRPASG